MTSKKQGSTKRGRPEKPKPDKAWAEAELARLERDAEHYRAIGSPLAELTEKLAAELRPAMGRQWRANRPREVWVQRGRGILHAGTYDPHEARRLALSLALSHVNMLLIARAQGEDVTELLKMATLACNEAADTYGNPRSERPLFETIEEYERAPVTDIDVESLRKRIGKARRVAVLTVASATGVSVETLADLLTR